MPYSPPPPNNEDDRLATLRRYNVLDTATEPIFDAITSLAAQICSTPIAILTLVDEHRQWFKSKLGVALNETPREIAFCSYTISEAKPFEVEDARSDPRFAENPLVTSDPRIRFYSGAPLVTEEGHALGALAVLDTRPRRLTTRQRELLAQLAHTVMLLLDLRRTGWKTSAQFAAIVASAPLPVIELDREGKVLSWNRAAELLFGWSAEETIGKEYPAVTGSDRDHFLSKVRDVFDTNSALEFEGKRRQRNGSILEVHISSAPVRSETGHVSSVMAVIQDVTSTKLARRQLEETVSLLTATLESTTDGILVVDRNGQIAAHNRKFREIWGFPDTLPASLPDSEVLPKAVAQTADPDAFLEKVRHLYSQPDLESFDIVELKDGRTIERYSQPQRIGDHIVGRVWSFRDVTHRVKLEQRFRQAQKMEAIGALAGGIAHDFNNLLNVIIGYSSLIAANVGPDSAALEYANNIRSAADTAANLTRQLLTFSRQQVPAPQVLDLNTVVRGLAKLVERLLPEHIVFRLETCDTPLPLKADPNQLEQLMMNLVVNARDAMPSGGVLELRTSLSRLSESGVEAARIQVRDTGHGMKPEVIERIFDPFFTTKPVGKGTGLGLSTVYGIVRQCGGDISLKSEIARGTTFTILLPLTSEALPGPITQETRTTTIARNETILLVEDNAALRALSLHILQKSGYKVQEASSGEEALALLSQMSTAVDLLISDVIMPGMSGRQLAEHARRLFPRLSVLLMSGYSEDALGDNVTSNFLQKPFTPDALLQQVRSILDQRIEPAA